MVMVHSCPKCGQPLAAQAPCPLCGWQPEPPAQLTHLLADGLVVTLRWRLVAGVPVGEPVETLPLWEWLQRHASSRGAGGGSPPPRMGR